jgi:hypothetical protein
MHAHAARLDARGNRVQKAWDVTLEARHVERPTLLAADKQLVLVYGDMVGSQAGVYVRALRWDGQIKQAEQLVDRGKAGPHWPSAALVSSGVLVAWHQDAENKKDDIWLRSLDEELRPRTSLPSRGTWGSTRDAGAVTPTVARDGNLAHVAYTYLSPDGKRGISLLHLDTGTPDGGIKVLGGPSLLVPPVGDAIHDGPSVACGRETCFVAWHNEPRGAFVGALDGDRTKLIWRVPLGPQSSRPALGVTEGGDVAVAYFDSGELRFARVFSDSVAKPISVAKASHAGIRPALGGDRGRGFWIAWQDDWGDKKDTFVAHAVCP